MQVLKNLASMYTFSGSEAKMYFSKMRNKSSKKIMVFRKQDLNQEKSAVEFQMPEGQKAWTASVQTSAKFQERKRNCHSFQRDFVILW